MPRISAYIIAYNEAAKVADAIRSVQWADEVIVADSNSTDETAAIAEALGARVVQIPFSGFGKLRNDAVAACTHDWVFSLDSDERCTPEVGQEVRELAERGEHGAFFVPRRNFFLGREIRHSGWYPNYRQPQLFRKDAMRYEMSPVHEGFELSPGVTTGYLRQAIWQLPFKDLHESIASSRGVQLAIRRKLDGTAWPEMFAHGSDPFTARDIPQHSFLSVKISDRNERAVRRKG